MNLENITETSNPDLIKKLVKESCRFWRGISPEYIKEGDYIATATYEDYSFGGGYMIDEYYAPGQYALGPIGKIKGKIMNFEFGQVEKITGGGCITYETTEPVVHVRLGYCQSFTVGPFGVAATGIGMRIKDAIIFKNEQKSIDYRYFYDEDKDVLFYRISEKNYKDAKQLLAVWKK